MKKSVRSPRRLRLLAMLLGAALLLWLPFEDTHERWVVLFALAVAGLAALAIWFRLPAAWRLTPIASTLVGLFGGLLVTPAALLLMAFKSGVHGHGRPDFTPQQVSRVLDLTPLWAAAGLLLGLGIALYRTTRPPDGEA